MSPKKPSRWMSFAAAPWQLPALQAMHQFGNPSRRTISEAQPSAISSWPGQPESANRAAIQRRFNAPTERRILSHLTRHALQTRGRTTLDLSAPFVQIAIAKSITARTGQKSIGGYWSTSRHLDLTVNCTFSAQPQSGLHPVDGVPFSRPGRNCPAPTERRWPDAGWTSGALSVG